MTEASPFGRPARWGPPLVLLCALALVLRLWGITWGLHNTNVSLRVHPDEWTVYWLFQWFGGSHPLDPCPGLPGKRCFYDWGMAYPYVAYVTYGILTHLPGIDFPALAGPRGDLTYVTSVFAGRLTSAVLSTATVGVLFAVSGRAYGVAAGLLTAGLAAMCGLLIQLGHFADPDSTTTLLVSLDFLALLYAHHRPDVRRYAIAGTVAGVAAGCEYHMVLLAVPILASWWLGGRRDSRLLMAAVAGAIVSYSVVNVYDFIHPSGFIDAIVHTLRIRTVDSTAEYQGRFNAYRPWYLYIVRYPLGYGVGVGMTLVLLAGAGRAAIRRDTFSLVLFSWLIIYGLLISLSSAKFMRYSAPLMPPLLVMAGAAISELASIRSAHIRGALTALTCLALAFSLVYDMAYLGLFTRTDSRLLAVAWLQRHVPGGSKVGLETLPDGVINLPYYVTSAGYTPCFTLFERRYLEHSAPVVLTDSYSLEEHPRISQQQVLAGRSILERSRLFRVVDRIHPVPALLGLQFPIDGAPHDWRYPDHVITIYRRVSGSTAARDCFPTMNAAIDALYHPGG